MADLWTLAGGLLAMPINRQIKGSVSSLLRYWGSNMDHKPREVKARTVPKLTDGSTLDDIATFYQTWRAQSLEDDVLSLYLCTQRGFFCLDLPTCRLMLAMPPERPRLSAPLRALYATLEPVGPANQDMVNRLARFQLNCILNMLLRDCHAILQRKGRGSKMPSFVTAVMDILEGNAPVQGPLTLWGAATQDQLEKMRTFLLSAHSGALFFDPITPTPEELADIAAQLGMVFPHDLHGLMLFIQPCKIGPNEGRKGWVCKHRLRYHIRPQSAPS